MSAEFYYSSDAIGGIPGSQFAEPDGSMHGLFVLIGDGGIILRVTSDQSKPEFDLMLTREQAMLVAMSLLEAYRRHSDYGLVH